MYSNKILNFQESTTILNAQCEKSLKTYRMHLVYVYAYIHLARPVGGSKSMLILLPEYPYPKKGLSKEWQRTVSDGEVPVLEIRGVWST